jgi:hypothetical protein
VRGGEGEQRRSKPARIFLKSKLISFGSPLRGHGTGVPCTKALVTNIATPIGVMKSEEEWWFLALSPSLRLERCPRIFIYCFYFSSLLF